MPSTSRDQLAILGGKPRFDAPLHVGRPNIGDRDQLRRYVDDILDSRWLTNDGPYSKKFEQRIADEVGAKHCIAMCNGTVALEIAIRAADLEGEVIVPSFTFIATAHALQWQQIKPVFCDIDPRRHTLDVAHVEKLITPRTTGIIGVHLWGRPCPIDGLTALAKKHNLRVLFDAAHAYGCSYKGRMIGSFGDMEVFSFHATKFVNSFEGGAVVTNDDALAKKVRLMRNFGFGGYDDVIYIGTNGKLPEIAAAMGLASLDACDEFITVNRRNYDAYRAALAELPGVQLVPYVDNDKRNYQYVVTEIDEDDAGLTRDELLQVLHAEHVLARRYFFPGCHRMEPYRTLYPDVSDQLPNTRRVAARVMTLPTGTSMDEPKIHAVCDILRSAMDHAQEVRAALQAAAAASS